LAAGTEWAELFQSSSIATPLALAIKGIERKARTALAHFGGDQRRLRRARLEERLPSITERLAEHADRGVAGLQFPEREFGLV
jgi:hypothetical protein